MRMAAVAVQLALTLVAARPELRAGYDCTTGCGGGPGGGGQACTAASFRLELLDALQWHPGLEVCHAVTVCGVTVCGVTVL